METKTLLIIAVAVAALAGTLLLLAAEPKQETAPVTAAAADSGSTSEASASAPQPVEPGAVAPPVDAAIDAGAPPAPTSERRVVATYFHNTARCVTCRKIESLAKETIEAVFAADLAAERLIWRTLNMEEGENEHYVFDYELTSPSLVLAEMGGESELRFKVLSDTWKLVHTKVQFGIYVENEVRAFLEGS